MASSPLITAPQCRLFALIWDLCSPTQTGKHPVCSICVHFPGFKEISTLCMLSVFPMLLAFWYPYHQIFLTYWRSFAEIWPLTFGYLHAAGLKRPSIKQLQASKPLQDVGLMIQHIKLVIQSQITGNSSTVAFRSHLNFPVCGLHSSIRKSIYHVTTFVFSQKTSHMGIHCMTPRHWRWGSTSICTIDDTFY